MGRIKRLISITVNRVHIGAIYLALILLVAMTIIIVINVFMRYVLDSGLQWAEELSKVLMVWFTFIGMAVGVKQGLHISIHILPKNLPARMDRILIFIKDMVTFGIALVFLVYGVKLVQFTSTSIMPATGWPSSILYLILPLSSILILSEVLMDVFHIDDDSESINRFFQRGDLT